MRKKPGKPFKLTPEQQDDVCNLAIGGIPPELLADKFGVCRLTILRTVRRRFPKGTLRSGRRRKLTPELEKTATERLRSGATVKAVAAELGLRISLVSSFASRLRRMDAQRERMKRRSDRFLSFDEREEVSRGLLAGESLSEIARRLNRSTSTISREVKKSGGRRGYRAWRAEDRASHARRRPKQAKLASNKILRARVVKGLRNFWSPEQISADLRRESPDDRTMQVSHETIYQSLYVQGRGALRAELKAYLRWKRVNRRKRAESAGEKRRFIDEMVMISERPAEVENRAVPGHWEGDLIIGRGGKSAVATLVERHSRYVMLAALPNGRNAEEVETALTGLIQRLPVELRKTLTWDQGTEMAKHASFTVASGVQVYFCDPHSPWQRGSNENTNGLLRQFLPRTTELNRKSQAELDEIARLLNDRPRQTLKWMRPSEVLNRAVATTA
jgi:transposase, IS30 family